jgi:glycosyltransferase involved in cell wall biosynthesis
MTCERPCSSVIIPGVLNPNQSQTGKKVCMLAYSFYESDNRIMRYAQALAERGDEVDVIALGVDEKQPAVEMLDGIKVHRIQRRQRNERSKYSYLWRLTLFCVRSSFCLGRLHWKRKYDLVHVHNVPDFLVFSAWLPRLAGAKIILDIHDILPEFFANKFRKSETSLHVKLLKLVEWLSVRFANHVVISNHLWFDRITGRSVSRGKCSVFINHVDTSLFGCKRTRKDDKFIMLYHGGLQRHQGLDVAIRAFAKFAPQNPEAEFHIYGGGNMKSEWHALARDLGLHERVRFFESLPARQIAQVAANADLGIVPKRADSFGNEAYSTKIMEFMSLGVPVVVSSTKIDRYYFDDSVVRFFESGNPDALAGAMLEMAGNPELRCGMAARASQYAVRNSWQNRKGDYLQLVDSLISSTAPPLAIGKFQPVLK